MNCVAPMSTAGRESAPQDFTPVPVSPHIVFDADEGRTVAACCLVCREFDEASVAIAHPFRLWIAALSCECGEQLVEYDALSWRVV